MSTFTRRKFLAGGCALAGASLCPQMSLAAGRGTWHLDMVNGNTGEKFRHAVIENGRWVKEALAEFDWFARDWREEAQYPIDTDSMMILINLQNQLDAGQPMVLLSGYRTPRTNGKIRGAAKNSLHMRGLALDLTQPGRSLRSLHKAASSLKAGGVGYYPSRNFVHIDSGPVRHWTA